MRLSNTREVKNRPSEYLKNINIPLALRHRRPVGGALTYAQASPGTYVSGYAEFFLHISSTGHIVLRTCYVVETLSRTLISQAD